MITVNCSQCKATLEMDDAFAGGVCRCHYCGTIQAVPANARRKSAAAASPAGVKGMNGSGQGRAPAHASGLDALADAVASGGMSRGTLEAHSQPRTPGAPPPVDYARPHQQRKSNLPLVVALVVIALLLGLVGFLVVGRTTTTTVVRMGPVAPGPGTSAPGDPGGSAEADADTGGGGEGGDTTAPEAGGDVAPPQTPHFCGISLQGVPSVVYVLDRGQSTAELFDTLKEVTYRSIESLKSGQKFQVMFWDNADGVAAYPPDGLAEASPQEIEAVKTQFADLIARGRAKADAAVARAARHRPAAIVIVTGKAYELDPALADAILDAVKGTDTKVHAVALRSDDDNTVLTDVARMTGGEYRVVTRNDLLTHSD